MTWLATVRWIPNSWISKPIIFLNSTIYYTDVNQSLYRIMVMISYLLLSVDVDIPQGCKTLVVVFVQCNLTIPFSWECCDQSKWYVRGLVRTPINVSTPLFYCRRRLTEAVRQKSRYNLLSLYQIRKIEIYLSSCKHWTEVSKLYYVARLRAH